MTLRRSRYFSALAVLSLLALSRNPGSPAFAQTVPADLCQGLVQDKAAHPMTALAKPAAGQAVRDPQFGTLLRRVTAVPAVGENPVLKPMYSTASAWNADESRLILYQVGSGHKLYDGRDYTFIGALDINPNELEGVFWHTTDPDLLFYPSGNQLVRYRVSTRARETLRTFTFCPGNVVAETHGFTSWDSNVFGLRCTANDAIFFYNVATGAVTGLATAGVAPLIAPSGTLAYLAGKVYDTNLALQRSLDVANAFEHASLGRLASGNDTYNAVQFDVGPGGTGVGSLVTHDMRTGAGRVIVGPATGYPYPPSTTHVSALAYRQPGWVYVSIVGDPAGQRVLDNELLLADTNTGRVCRVGHHRSAGDSNTHLGLTYWAEPHIVASPSGTRALFGSDWGNGATVDTYALELPSYVWFNVAGFTGDFNGDGKADLLWYNPVNRTLAIQFLNGSTVLSGAGLRTFADGNWQVVGTGDYNGDRRSDVLLRNRQTNEVRVWLLSGATIISDTQLAIMSDAWQVAGSRDHDGDGKDDVLWYNVTTGAVGLWLMAGSYAQTGLIVGQMTEPGWRIVASGDLNGDRRADVVWRNSLTGAVRVWLMDGSKATSQVTVANVPDASWQVVGDRDYNGDGKADLLWRNRVTGAVRVDLMNGTTIASQTTIGTVSDTNWRIMTSADFDGDGKADFAWWNPTAGAGAITFLNGGTVLRSGALPSVTNLSWQVVQAP